MIITRRKAIIITLLLLVTFVVADVSYAFWIWTPKSKTFINPKFAVKDTPQAQYDWAMRFYEAGDFARAADEFRRLTEYYPDSDLAPESQYYAGRSYEESGKYLFAFQNYQKTIDNYPYTRRMEDILRREYNIANIFQTKDTAKLMNLELSESMDRAAEMYKSVVDNSPFGEYAEKALYKSAECYRRMRKYKEAVEAYERIINDYPESGLVPEAKYQMAYTKYEASLNPEYDQESTDEALKEFKQISDTTAVPAIAVEAQKVFDQLKERKADSILNIARFYDKNKKYKGALMYYDDIVTRFEGTEAAGLAQKRIDSLKKKVK